MIKVCTVGLAVVALFLFGGAARSFAQNGPPSQPDTAGSALRPLVSSVGPLLDAPVNRSEYLLGPGDAVNVSVTGEVNFLYPLVVTPEGTVVIPRMGVANVLGLNLNEAEARVRDLVLRYYRGVNVDLTLSGLRTFKVFVVGNVPAPGVQVASSATRVSEVIRPAGPNGIVRRNVLLRRASGDTLRIDLVRFVQTGDLGANPTLREGDALVVPTTDRKVEIFGRVAYPGTYEHRAGESLAELLSMANAGGGFPSNAADTVRVTRFVGPQEREFFTLSRAEAMGSRGRNFALQPFDAIYVAALSNFKRQQTAHVAGEVMRPGTYPIRPDTTTVTDLVAMAGGFTPEASLVAATLRRNQQNGGSDAEQGLQAVPPEFLSPTERQIAQIRSQGDETNVVIDFERLFREGVEAFDQTLHSGDVLTIPERRDEVVILGAVAQPGIVAYAPGKGVSYYVALAGGYTRQADRGDAVVLKAKLGTRIDAREVRSVEPGDQVVVPFKERRTPLELLQTTSSIVTTISGLIFAIIALRSVLP